MSGFFIIDTREGAPSLGYLGNMGKIHLHSTYAPLREAAQFIEARKGDIAGAKVILVYGIGLGYHIREMEKFLKPETKVYVLDMNPKILEYTTEIFSLSEYQRRGFSFLASDDIQAVKEFISSALRGCEPDEFLLLIHQPSLKIIPEQCQPIKNLLENWETQRESFDYNGELMIDNFQQNISSIGDYYSVASFQNKFANMPITIVSAGPSLNKNIHLLPQLKGKAVIIAVGRVARLLLERGIRPDGLVISDPHPIVKQQIENLEIDVPLFFFPTVSPVVLREYKGPKVLLLQNGFEGSEDLASKYSYPLLETGGSVATTALSLALFFGGNPIILIGQDLAYTAGQTHATGCAEKEVKEELKYIWVKGNDGSQVPTVKNLFIFLKWMENTILAQPQVRFINATEGGAFIEGTEVMHLQKLIDELVPIKAGLVVQEMSDKLEPASCVRGNVR